MSQDNMDSVKSLDLDAIKKRADAALPGPWRVVPEGSGYASAITRIGDAHAVPFHAAGIKTAEFLCAAREDVPALVAEVERLRRIELCVREITKNVGGALREDLEDALRGQGADL